VEHRTLGRSGLDISAVGFGCWAIGGDRNAVGHWGPVDDDESVAAIHAALDRGVTWIDTAPGYGSGHSEEVVGRALRGLAERPLVFTKCGFVWNERYELWVDLSPASLRRELDASLRRLGVDALDLWQIHWLEPENDPELEDAWATLAELKREGKARHIGVSNLTVAQLERCEAIAPVETLQPPYSLVERAVEDELLPYTEAHDIGVIVYSPMQSGLLSGRMTRERIDALPADDARRFDPNFEEPLLSHNLELVERVREEGARRGLSVAQAAIAWTLANPAVDGAIVGFRRPQQVEEILGGPPLTVDAGLATLLGG
jgi:aryl-alcohol dehydrogenase-like predicted oxidoreductase